MSKLESFAKAYIADNTNKDGCYEAYWDYHCEGFSASDIQNAVDNYAEEGFTSISAYLENILYENIEYALWDEFYEGFARAVNNSNDEELQQEFKDCQDINEVFENAGFNGVDVNFDEYLSKTEICIDIMLATAAEMNFDMASIVSSYGQIDGEESIDSINPELFDNALTYLIHQQGFTVKDIAKAVGELNENCASYEGHSFAGSIAEELANNSSEALSEVCVLSKLSGQQIIDFYEEISKVAPRNIKINKNAVVGIFNEWSGCGGCLDIELAKDMIISPSIIRNVIIEGGDNHYSCTVDQVYSLCENAWKEVLSYTDEKPELVEEKISTK